MELEYATEIYGERNCCRRFFPWHLKSPNKIPRLARFGGIYQIWAHNKSLGHILEIRAYYTCYNTPWRLGNPTAIGTHDG